MSIISFTKQEKEELVSKIQEYFADKLDQELGRFEAEFLLNFIADVIGPYFYNKGIHDSQAMLQKKVDEIIEAIDSLEKPLNIRRKRED
ncbi:MAG TPA: DUF2164 domain-containing protein [Melioribacteraceae bacterium]|nr:DUF2164 domain-containing protein [Melioribacteraceae bacterium]